MSLNKAISESWIVHSSLSEVHGLLTIYPKPGNGDADRGQAQERKTAGGTVCVSVWQEEGGVNSH